jgi:uncharacterized protein YkwD
MRVTNRKLGQAALLGCVLVAPAGGSGARAEQDPEADAKLKGITALHNEARRDLQPHPKTPLPPLEWDEELAKGARDWASRCVYKHSGKDVGENIYASAGADTKPADVVANWRGERANYKYKSNTCARGKTCGHYTQLVWRGSQHLGCAQKTCTKGSPFGSGFPTWQFWVCNYDPRGNINGERPY